MVVYIQLVDVAVVAAVFAPVAAVFDVAAEMGVCAVGECVHVAQAGAYAEVSRELSADVLRPMEMLYSRA